MHNIQICLLWASSQEKDHKTRDSGFVRELFQNLSQVRSQGENAAPDRICSNLLSKVSHFSFAQIREKVTDNLMRRPPCRNGRITAAWWTGLRKEEVRKEIVSKEVSTTGTPCPSLVSGALLLWQRPSLAFAAVASRSGDLPFQMALLFETAW